MIDRTREFAEVVASWKYCENCCKSNYVEFEFGTFRAYYWIYNDLGDLDEGERLYHLRSVHYFPTRGSDGDLGAFKTEEETNAAILNHVNEAHGRHIKNVMNL